LYFIFTVLQLFS